VSLVAARRSWLLVPFALGTAALVVIPAGITFVLAFFEYDGVGAARWVGLDNLRLLFDDPFLADAVRASAIFVAIAVPLRLAVATGLALLLHRRFRGVGAARTIAFLPTIVPDAAMALTWAWLLNPIYGPVNVLLGGLGLPQPDWFSDPSGARALYVLVAAFTIGEGFIVALAARQELPRELEELARVEGASPWFITRKVTLPLMAPTLGLIACRDVAISLQSVFAATYLITDGGPDRATLFLPVLIYDYSFEQLRYGYAAALTLVMFVLTTLLVLALARGVRRWHVGFAD
jgi:multiple sugar transport system permease protein